MTPWLDDGDVRVYVGDVRAVLAGLPDESVDCVITSPPYWGLRDYGTGSWDGGNDPDCDHRHDTEHQKQGATSERARRTNTELQRNENFRDVCGKCGAQRVDQQLGLEPTPDAYVHNMVAVFREVRRVLAPHGTCWLNLGDSYASGEVGRVDAERKAPGGIASTQAARSDRRITHRTGLKRKDLVGIPWRVAFALQADGWWLRSEIIWAKPNPMPESVTDRPTKSHEQVFLLAKRPVYWFDQEAVREPNAHTERVRAGLGTQPGSVNNVGIHARGGNTVGRNVRSVWDIATQPFPDAHFATYPEELVRRCLLAGCPAEVCGVCGKPRERIVERTPMVLERSDRRGQMGEYGRTQSSGTMVSPPSAETVGWSDCGHNAYRPGVVLDPFLGSGTTALVARNHGQHAVGIELNEEYARIAARRLQQLSLLA